MSLDVCLVTEGAWPQRTGGLSTWTQHLLAALAGADLGVVSLGPAAATAARYAPPPGARIVERVEELRRVPDAVTYLASGLEAAEALLCARPDLAARTWYVEHGDLVREILHGAAVCESGRPVTTTSRPMEAERARRRRRRAALACRGVVGVTGRTVRRAAREGAAEARLIPNAVPPPAEVAPATDAASGCLGFVGRFSRVKGLDRFEALARSVDRASVAIGIPVGEPWGSGDLSWEVADGDPWRRRPIGLLALPSRLEASPFAALEAESLGIPVLLSAAAELAGSPLITRLAWSRPAWAAEAHALLRGGREPALGAGLAAARWRAFTSSWRALAAA